jgi:hypothetical protein
MLIISTNKVYVIHVCIVFNTHSTHIHIAFYEEFSFHNEQAKVETFQWLFMTHVELINNTM